VGGAPGTHPLEVLGAAEVVAVGRLGEPLALALGLACPAAIGLGAETLVAPVAGIGSEQPFAVAALTSSFSAHHPPLPERGMIGEAPVEAPARTRREEDEAKGKKIV